MLPFDSLDHALVYSFRSCSGGVVTAWASCIISFRLAFTADPFEVRTACVIAVVAETDPSIPTPFVRSSLVVTRRSFADLSHITFRQEPAEF